MNRRVIYEKTQKGMNELRSRQLGLSPRLYQLLPLLDGNNSRDALLKIFARHELDAYLAILETGGYIYTHDDRIGHEPDDFEALRHHAIRHLLSTVGEAGEPFALRVAKCTNLQELRSLVSAMESIVEVCHGPGAAQQFAREALLQ